MSEKKKRVRPTLAMVRELEAEIESLRRCGVGEWRRMLDEQIEATSCLVRDCDAWRESYRELLRVANSSAAEVRRLRGRGFWSRVFNR